MKKGSKRAVTKQRGPKADRLVIDANWREAVKRAMAKGKPRSGVIDVGDVDGKVTPPAEPKPKKRKTAAKKRRGAK